MGLGTALASLICLVSLQIQEKQIKVNIRNVEFPDLQPKRCLRGLLDQVKGDVAFEVPCQSSWNTARFREEAACTFRPVTSYSEDCHGGIDSTQRACVATSCHGSRRVDDMMPATEGTRPSFRKLLLCKTQCKLVL